MTAPGERLTPQQMREVVRSVVPGRDYDDLLGLCDRALAAWQADREALGRAELLLRDALNSTTGEDGAPVRWLVPVANDLAWRDWLAGVRSVLAELDAAQGETK